MRAAAVEDGPTVEHVAWRVPSSLAGIVSSGVGYRLEGFPAGVHAGLPSRCLSVVFSFGAPLEVVPRGDGNGSPEPLTASASGLHGRAVEIRHDGTEFGIHLELTPAGSRALFGMPASELASTVVPLDVLLGPAGNELVERLTLSPDWPARFGLLERSLTAALRPPRPAPAEVTYVWTRLAETGGSAGVATLSAEVGWSRRHLSERFKQEVGLSPKVVARIMRFEGAVGLLRRASPRGLAEVAAVCGYADQAHLTREWVDLTGASPTAWAAAEQFPFVQDTIVDAVGS